MVPVDRVYWDPDSGSLRNDISFVRNGRCRQWIQLRKGMAFTAKDLDIVRLDYNSLGVRRPPRAATTRPVCGSLVSQLLDRLVDNSAGIVDRVTCENALEEWVFKHCLSESRPFNPEEISPHDKASRVVSWLRGEMNAIQAVQSHDESPALFAGQLLAKAGNSASRKLLGLPPALHPSPRHYQVLRPRATEVPPKEMSAVRSRCLELLEAPGSEARSTQAIAHDYQSRRRPQMAFPRRDIETLVSRMEARFQGLCISSSSAYSSDASPSTETRSGSPAIESSEPRESGGGVTASARSETSLESEVSEPQFSIFPPLKERLTFKGVKKVRHLRNYRLQDTGELSLQHALRQKYVEWLHVVID
ncbi:MAG: hypothetical protein KVP17_005169 [Porospora cf. gigantea B]|uniref:uncharacterized protein n=1 Tax=Porospora cf. gigantea B TaxID=2853592 RepID=UPI0035719A6E|nr:MAG: hypothetical protein KVP17_005169 [Porospora cf. gigantea B]